MVNLKMHEFIISYRNKEKKNPQFLSQYQIDLLKDSFK